MVLSNQETLDLIRMLLTKHVPASLDRQNVFDKLAEVGKALLAPAPGGKECPKCGKEMFCPECADITVCSEVETTIRVNGKEIIV